MPFEVVFVRFAIIFGLSFVMTNAFMVGRYTRYQTRAAPLSDSRTVSLPTADEPYSLVKCHRNIPTLVLNADYTPLSHAPLSLWNWRDSLSAIFSDKAVVVSEYNNLLIRSVSRSFRIPSVIAMKEYYRRPADKAPAITRRFIYMRDGYCCQVGRCSCPEQDSPHASINIYHGG